MRHKNVFAVQVAFNTLLMCAAVAAQVSTPPSSNPVKIEFENEQIRVSRVKLAPGETLKTHQWMSSVQVPLSSNEVTLTCVGRQPRVAHIEAGKPGWSEAAECSVANDSKPFEAIVVERKNANEPARALAEPTIPHPPNYLDEPLHHWAFENQYVRVYDVHLPPGLITGYHTHAFDTLFVEISGGTEAAQMKGQENWTSATERPGEVAFSPDSKKTRIHRVRNDGKDEYHVVAIQVLDSPSK